MQNKNENKAATPAEIYNSSEAIRNREQVKKEINSTPRLSFSNAFEKTDEERSKLWGLRNLWRKIIQGEGLSKRKVPMKTYLKLS